MSRSLSGINIELCGICTISGTEGFSFEEIKDLFLNKKGNKLVAENLISFEEVNKRIWEIKTEIFAPCAASRLVTRHKSIR